MKPKTAQKGNRLTLPLFGFVMAVLTLLFLSYKAYGLGLGMSLSEVKDAIQATPGPLSVLLINALAGFSVFLLIWELRWDAARVLLTVVVALIFGYLMTAFFSLDAADSLIRGEFRIKVVSDAEALTTINYGEKIATEFSSPQDAVSYTFAGRAGDVVSVLAYVDQDVELPLALTLRDENGNVLGEGTQATKTQTRAFRRYLTKKNGYVIQDFTLPEDGFYTITAQAAEGVEEVNAEVTVALVSDAPPLVDFAYNSKPVGAIFNKEKVSNPLREAEYHFAGREGDVVTILAYVSRPEVGMDLQVTLYGPDGEKIAFNDNATDAQVEQFSRELKSTRDAILQDVTLPAEGVYTVYVRPNPLDTSVRIKETIKATNKAYDAFLLGPLSRLNRWVVWIRDALTLILLGLSIAMVFRARQFSLGAEGQLYFGALVSGVVGLTFGNLPSYLLVPIALLSAATAGFLWGLLPGALKAYLGADELVSTLMLNMVAQRFYEMVLTFQLKPPDAGYTYSDWIPENGLLAPIVDVTGDQVTIAVYIVIAMVVLTWLMIRRTPIGYEIRMIGANIKFANYGGVNTKRTIMLVMAISGAVAGLAGAHLAMGMHRRLILNISVGLAFEGVVVALLARNNPLVVPFTGLLYAYLRTGAQVMERDANISSEVVRIIQAVVILLITAEALVTFVRRRRIRRRGTLELDMGEGQNGNGSLTPAEEGAHG